MVLIYQKESIATESWDFTFDDRLARLSVPLGLSTLDSFVPSILLLASMPSFFTSIKVLCPTGFEMISNVVNRASSP